MDQRSPNDAVIGSCRLAALVLAVLFALCGMAAVLLARTGSIVTDFLSYWAAGHLVAAGQPAAAYDIVSHHVVEARVVPDIGLLPFSYPPAYLLLIGPFGTLPFWIALALWMGVGAVLYLFASRRIVEPRFAFAQAGAAANFITGQNGFLTSAIFIAGTGLLVTRPLVAGAVLGLLSVKPHLALLLPVALIAGREWRAIAGAAVSSLALMAIAWLLFGIDSYSGFFEMLSWSSQSLSAGRWPWGELATTFAMLRALGAPAKLAIVIHVLIAFGAAALTARAWTLRLETRVPILAAATLLIPPYLFTYDALVLSIPLGWLLRQPHARAPLVVVWFLSLLPVVNYFTAFPNTIPLAAIIALWALHQTERKSAREPAYQA